MKEFASYLCKVAPILYGLTITSSNSVAYDLKSLMEEGDISYVAGGELITENPSSSFTGQPTPSLSTDPFLRELEQELTAFNEFMLIVLKPEPNIFLNYKHIVLKHYHEGPEESWSSVVEDLLDRLSPLEKMLAHEKRLQVLSASRLSPEDPALKGITQLIQDIRLLLKGDLNPTLQEALQGLATYYQTYLDKLCSESPDQRLKLLTYRAKIVGDRLRYNYIPQGLAHTILSKTINGLSLKELHGQQEGQNAVTFLNHGQERIYFKVGTSFSDINPAMEWAIHSLSSLLFPEKITPASACLKVNARFRIMKDASQPLAKKAYHLFNQLVVYPEPSQRMSVEDFFIRYPAFENYFTEVEEEAVVQATYGMGDKSLYWLLTQNSSPYKLDQNNYSALFILSLITVLTDAKDDNLTVTLQGGQWYLSSIDSDRALAEMIAVNESTGKHVIQGKNILYLLDGPMRDKIAPKVVDHILSLSAPALMLDWLYALDLQNQRYKNLTPERGSAYFPLLLKPGTVLTILERFLHIQKYLNTKTTIATHDDLLEEIFPLAHYGYKRLRQTYPDQPHEAQEHLYQARHYPDLFLEDLLAEEEEPSPLLSMLSEETAVAGGYETNRTQEIEDAIQELLNHIALRDLSAKDRLQVLHRMVQRWPYKRGRLWQGSEIIGKVMKDILSSTSDLPAAEIIDYVLNFPHIDINYVFYSLISPDDKQTLMHLLASWKDSSVANLIHRMITNGGRINAYNDQGLTPLDIAIDRDNRPAIGALLIHQAHLYLYPSNLLHLINTYAALPSFNLLIEQMLNINSEAAWFNTINSIFQPSHSSTAGLKVQLVSLYQGKWRIEHRLLSDQDATSVFKKGIFQPVYKTGNHHIGLLKHDSGDIFLKWRPTFPGIEIAIQALTRRLFPEIVLPVSLVKINGEPYLISQARGGGALPLNFDAYQSWTLNQILEQNPGIKFDSESFSQIVIMAILLGPEDGKPSNYSVEPIPGKPGSWRLISIDGDQALAPDIAKSELNPQGKKTIRIKSILFCFDQMLEEIHPAVRQRLLEIDPYALVRDWLHELQEIHQQHLSLFADQQDKLAQQNCFIGIPFQEGEIERLVHKLITLQLLSKEKLDPTLEQVINRNNLRSLATLFKKICPFSAHHYKQALTTYKDKSVKQRFDSLDGDSYKRKNDREAHTTLTSGRDMLQARNIPVFKRRSQATADGKSYDPAMMLKELEAVEKVHNNQQLANLILQRHTNDKMASHILKAKDLTKIDLDLKLYSQAQHSQLFNEIKKLKIREFYWRNGMLPFTLINYSPFLKNLVALNIQGCPLVTLEFLEALSKEVLQLEYLNLSQISSLEVLKAPNFLGLITINSLIFNNLRFLIVNDCVNLKEINLRAPNLNLLEAARCFQLKTLKVIAPTVKTLNFSKCKLITTEEVLKLNNPSLITLRIQGCPQFSWPQELHHLLLGHQSDEALWIKLINNLPDFQSKQMERFIIRAMLVGYYGTQRMRMLMADLLQNEELRLAEAGSPIIGVNIATVRCSFNSIPVQIDLHQVPENHRFDNVISSWMPRMNLILFDCSGDKHWRDGEHIIRRQSYNLKRWGFNDLPKLLITYNTEEDKQEFFEHFKKEAGINTQIEYTEYKDNREEIISWIYENALPSLIKQAKKRLEID
ncbi:MAG: hypothetical protein K0M45_12005 [Candidatus Paracaedibacteraceae bacterium]|nr:hypothetical protein [Candidatus Paracaedibacteraceae bacterium]